MIKLSEIPGLMIDRKILDLPDEDIETFISGFNDAIFTQGQKSIGLKRTRMLEICGEVHTQDAHARKELDSQLMISIVDSLIAHEKELFEVKE